MSIRIVQETVNGITDKRAVLFSQGIMRKMSIGTTWGKIRIAMAVNTTGTTAITGTPRLYFGLLQGTDNGVLSNTTDAFFGLRTNDTDWGTVPLHDCRSWQLVYKKNNSFTTFQTVTPAAEIASVDSADDYTNCIVMDVRRAAANAMAVEFWVQGVTADEVHITSDLLMEICNSSADPSTITGTTYTKTTFNECTVADNTIYDSIAIATSFLRDFQVSAVSYGRMY